MLALGAAQPFAIGEEQRLMRDDVDEARHAAARAVERFQRGVRKERRPGIPRDRKPVGDIVRDLAAAKRLQRVLESDALAQLAHRVGSELAVELGLAEEHHLHELALFGFEVREQAHRLQRGERHGLGLVHAKDDALALAGDIEQPLGQILLQPVRLDQIGDHAELVGKCEHHHARFYVRIRYVGTYPARSQGRQELAAKERLAGADLARDLDEALAVRNRDDERIERLLDAATGEEIARVRRDAEGHLAQAKMLEIVHFMRSMRLRVWPRSSSQLRSDWITVGLSRITSSRLAPRRSVLRARSPSPPSVMPGSPPRLSRMS